MKENKQIKLQFYVYLTIGISATFLLGYLLGTKL